MKLKHLLKHISCDYKCKFNSINSNLNQKWYNDTCRCKCKKCCMWKKYDKWHEINMTNTISTNVASIVSINSGDKTVRYKMDYYILLMILLGIILLFIIASLFAFFMQNIDQNKKTYCCTNIKIVTNEFKKC